MNRMFELFYLNDWGTVFIQNDEIVPQFWEIYGGDTNHTFLDWEFHIMKNFMTPKDAIEREFVAQKLQEFRKQVNDLLGQNGILLTPAFPTPVPYHHMEPFESFNLYYTMVV